jgi:hypothetical protein
VRSTTARSTSSSFRPIRDVRDTLHSLRAAGIPICPTSGSVNVARGCRAEGRVEVLRKPRLEESRFAQSHDQNGRKYDIDFLAAPNGRSVVVTRPVLHAIDGKERPHHLELK